jgi:hypothetical protein
MPEASVKRDVRAKEITPPGFSVVSSHGPRDQKQNRQKLEKRRE